MAASHKRIFAGKQNLQPEPFCPYLSNESGYLSQKQHISRQQRKPSRLFSLRTARHVRLFAGSQNSHRF